MSAVRARRRAGLWRARDGAASLEFAAVALPLLALSLGTIELARVLWTKEALAEAAIAGARCMGVLSTSCTAAGTYSAVATTSFIQNEASGWGISIPSTALTLSNITTCAGVSGFSQVSISYNFQTALPSLLPSLATLALSAQACFPNKA